MPRQRQRELERVPGSPGVPGEGPRAPSIDKPDTRQLIEKMRRVDPSQRRKFRQHSGE